jgi:uncharacterized membrane protein YhaH (DUF805 family)
MGVLALFGIGIAITTYAFQRAGRSFSAIRDDPRFALWREGLRALGESPWGGGKGVFEGVSVYAHNAILDLGLDTNIISALILAALVFGLTAVAIRRLHGRSRRVSNVEFCLLAILSSHLLVMMTEPFLTKRLLVFLWAAVAYLALAGRRAHPPPCSRASKEQPLAAAAQQ